MRRTQVRTSLQHVICLVGGTTCQVWLSYKHQEQRQGGSLQFNATKQELSRLNVTRLKLKQRKTTIKIHSILITISCLVFSLAGIVTAAPVACCTKDTNHAGETSPPGPCASTPYININMWLAWMACAITSLAAVFRCAVSVNRGEVESVHVADFLCPTKTEETEDLAPCVQIFIISTKPLFWICLHYISIYVQPQLQTKTCFKHTSITRHGAHYH